MKNVVQTSVAGRKGKIKEYISMDDYDIVIRGVFASDSPRVHPFREIKRLSDLGEVPTALRVGSPFLSLFSITSMVILKISFPQQMAMYNMQPFEIRAVSDDPVELSIRTE